MTHQLGLQPATVGNFFMNARRRLHDKWQELHLNDHDATSGDGSLMNDDESDFVNDLVDEQQQQQQQQQQHLDSNDLQACLGHESVQAMLMEHQVDECGGMVVSLDPSRGGHHSVHLGEGNLHLNHHLENVPKENNIRLQLSVPHQHHQQQQQHLHQLQHQHEHQHVYSLTSL